jgi:hypothetical protein
MRAPSLPLSVLLHSAAAAAVIVGFSLDQEEALYVPPVPVELLTEAELSELLSVPEMVRAEEPAEEPEPVIEEPVEEPEPILETPAPQPEPEPAPEPEPIPEEPQEVAEADPEPEPQPEPEPEPEPEEPPAPEPEPTEDDLFADLGNALPDLDPDRADRRAPAQVNPEALAGDRNQERIGEGNQLTIREEDLLRACIVNKWNEDQGALNWQDLVVKVEIELNIDGTLARPPRVINDAQINRSGNPAWQAARQRALVAIRRCEPFTGLDPSRYNQWRIFTYNFDPEDF